MTYGAKQLIGKIGSVIGVCLMLAGFIYLNVSFPDKETDQTNYVKLGEFPEIHKPKR